MPIRMPGDAECCAVGARAFAGRLRVHGPASVGGQHRGLGAGHERAALRRRGDAHALASGGPPDRVVVEIVDRAARGAGPRAADQAWASGSSACTE